MAAAGTPPHGLLPDCRRPLQPRASGSPRRLRGPANRHRTNSRKNGLRIRTAHRIASKNAYANTQTDCGDRGGGSDLHSSAPIRNKGAAAGFLLREFSFRQHDLLTICLRCSRSRSDRTISAQLCRCKTHRPSPAAGQNHRAAISRYSAYASRKYPPDATTAASGRLEPTSGYAPTEAMIRKGTGRTLGSRHILRTGFGRQPYVLSFLLRIISAVVSSRRRFPAKTILLKETMSVFLRCRRLFVRMRGVNSFFIGR